MIRNAVGMVISRMIVTATTNLTMSMLADRMSRTVGPSTTIAATATAVTTSSSGTTVKTIFPGRVSRFQDFVTTVMPGPCRLEPPRSPRACRFVRWPSFVDAAHDRVERGHDRHRVGDQVARHHQADRLEVDERRVVDPHPEGLVRPVADRIGRILTARTLDRGVRPARARPQEPRQLGHDRAVGHLVQALVDDPQALLDL